MTKAFKVLVITDASEHAHRAVDTLMRLPLLKRVEATTLSVAPKFAPIFAEHDAVRECQKDNVDFLMVYVRKAHPTDRWAMRPRVIIG